MIFDSTKTIRLHTLDFYEMIVDAGNIKEVSYYSPLQNASFQETGQYFQAFSTSLETIIYTTIKQ